MFRSNKEADICLFLEGTYPYVSGGVASWAHELLLAQDNLTFHIVSIVPKDIPLEPKYKLPSNVISHTNLVLSELPKGTLTLPVKKSKKLFEGIEIPLLNLQTNASLQDLERIIQLLHNTDPNLGRAQLLDSPESWNMLLRMYHATMGDYSFLDYFWSWRALYGGLFSILLSEIPRASCYHALCTGYAGLLLARTHIETGKPCILTEHGIYTNERRIEITSADWLVDQNAMNLNVKKHRILDRTLRDFWIDTFRGYSKCCYHAADRIITLYEGNKELQMTDGATPEKTSIIPNGIDVDRFSAIQREPREIPHIALIGRVVPIKDIKTFIRACEVLKNQIPNFKAYIMGSLEEDPEYAVECQQLVKESGLEEFVEFTGNVNIMHYLGHIDVIVLSSISEAQPLVLLEAGAAGIPAVTTNVGACSEILLGHHGEEPALGPGGMICPLSNPDAMGKALLRLLTDRPFREHCGRTLQDRIKRYYHRHSQHTAYKELYEAQIKYSASIKAKKKR